MAVQEVPFLFIGGIHQVYHLAPVAAELARRRPDLKVVCICADARSAALIERLRAQLDAPALEVASVRKPLLGLALARLFRRKSLEKRPFLWRVRGRLRRAGLVVVPERTSAILRKMGLKSLYMIHFRHGAGDRAPPSEDRLHLFDLIVVPGPKDARRAVKLHGLNPARLATSGYVKLDLIERLQASSAPLFDNGRRTIVFNPHFNPGISCFAVADRVIAAVAAQDRYNLVFAPHIRVAANMDAAERARWEAMAIPGRIIIDLGSDRLVDMSYTLGADIYLGDRSSQLYEFLAARPRPAIFIDLHNVAGWREDPQYAGWHLGELITDPAEILPAIERAIARQSEREPAQRAAVVEAFGDYKGAAARGAGIVAAAADRLGARARPA